MNNQKHDCHGVTLIELLVVLVIVSILVAIAYPNYLASKRETRRGDAHSSLMTWKSAIDRYMTANNTNTWTAWSAVPRTGTPEQSSQGYYDIIVEPCSSSCVYIVTATARSDSDQANDISACTTITLDSTGTRSPADCW